MAYQGGPDNWWQYTSCMGFFFPDQVDIKWNQAYLDVAKVNSIIEMGML